MIRPLVVLFAAAAVVSGHDAAAQVCAPPCMAGQVCVVDQCVWGCGNFAEKHCCYKNHVVGCSSDFQHALVGACEPDECGWSEEHGYYTCGHAGSDPAGLHPKDCEFACVPKCPHGVECGPDGCGGSCGACAPDQVCADGACCTPSCDGKACGNDGCGGSCGGCEEGQTCAADRCLWGCNSISEKGCCYGDQLVHCFYDGTLQAGACPHPECGWDDQIQAYTCGTDGGEDPTGKYPRACDFTCKTTCGTASCGPDGCGGTCGTCEAGEVCWIGSCCEPSCPEGKWACGSDGCGGSCGVCPEGFWCTDLKQCAYGYGCEETKVHGCPACECEDCVCGMDPYCCTSAWDWKCTYYCEFECGGCVPCGGDGCLPVPEMLEQVEVPPEQPGDSQAPGETTGPTDTASPGDSGAEVAADQAPDGGPDSDLGPAPEKAEGVEVPSIEPRDDGVPVDDGAGGGGCSVANEPPWAPWAVLMLFGLAAVALCPLERRRRQ